MFNLKLTEVLNNCQSDDTLIHTHILDLNVMKIY